MAGPCLKQEPVLALPIFPGRRQPSIVGRNELNYRVRNGNGWTLALISTNFVVAKSAQLRFRLRRKLRSLPCSSSSTFKRFAGLKAESLKSKVRSTPFPAPPKTAFASLLLLFHFQTLRWFESGVLEKQSPLNSVSGSAENCVRFLAPPFRA